MFPAFIELRSAIMADGVREGVPFIPYDLEYLRTRVGAEGREFALVTLPKSGKAIERSLVSGQLILPTDFGFKGLTRLPEFCHSVFQKVYSDDGMLLSNPCLTAIKYLRYLFSFDSKLVSVPTKEQEKRAIEGFRVRQSDLLKVRLPLGHPVLEGAVKLLTKVLKDSLLDDITPGHGPGNVSERVPQDMKWDFTTWPVKAEKFYPYVSYGVHLAPLSRQERWVTFCRDSTTRIALVPKDFRGPRLISAESTVTQYLQQGQMSALMRYINRHSLLKRSIQLKDQTFNQKKAFTANENGLITLDLSDASDTVSCALVWYLFSGVPNLRRRLFSTRSQFASFRGELVRVVAFAPMGSAVCFPVETLVFWALTMSACRRDPVFRHESWNAIASKVAVFGDDIICPDTTLNFLTDILLRVGCRPNQDKTCWATPFRESCGSEWFNHQDITITRNRRFTYEACQHVSQYHEVLGLSRRLWWRGLYASADLLSGIAEKFFATVRRDLSRNAGSVGLQSGRRGGLTEPSSTSIEKFLLPADRTKCSSNIQSPKWQEDQGLFDSWDRSDCEEINNGFWLSLMPVSVDQYPVSFSPGNTRVKSRWNRNLQRLEYMLPVSLQKTRVWEPSPEQRLLARLLGDSTERVATRGRKTKMAWIWIPPHLGRYS